MIDEKYTIHNDAQGITYILNSDGTPMNQEDADIIIVGLWFDGLICANELPVHLRAEFAPEYSEEFIAALPILWRNV